MTDETRTLEVPVYRDPTEGRPTCEGCPMLHYEWDYDLEEKGNGTCGYLETELVSKWHGGWIRPSPNCPLWKGDK